MKSDLFIISRQCGKTDMQMRKLKERLGKRAHVKLTDDPKFLEKVRAYCVSYHDPIIQEKEYGKNINRTDSTY